MRRSLRIIGLSISLVVCITRSQTLAATPSEVESALSKGKAYLYSVQTPNGTWESEPAPAPPPSPGQRSKHDQSAAGGQYSGMTALVVYAMLSAGEQATDPKLAKAIEFLKKTDTLGTYALGVRCQIWQMLPQTPEVKARMQKDVQVLLRTAKTDGDAAGMYDYVFDKGPAYSHSRSQYAVLGVWAAERAGQKIPEAYWQTIEKAWIRNQDASGGWSYQNQTKYPITPGMTAVGVATLFITQDYVGASAGALCRSNVNSPAITKGMDWMAANMSKVATDEKYDRDFPYPTLFAVERIGVAAGVKYIGGVDWYQKGADWLLEKQAKSGAWPTSGFGDARHQNTAFAMLFLARGRAPLVMNKLDYSTDQAKPVAWNQRPRDVANVVRWISTNTERDLGWQSVTLNAPLKDLAEAPILFLAGSDAIKISDEHKAKLKEFVEAGGLILGHADCGKAEFSTSFKKLAGEVFPVYEFRELPESSPVYSIFPRAKWRTKPSVLSVNNGTREIMMLIPQADPGKAWQTRQLAGKEPMYQLLANIFLYATNKEKLQYRGASFVVESDPNVKPTRTIDVARLQFDGNWDPEPGAWRRFAGLLHNDKKTGVDVKSVKALGGDFGNAKFAHLVGAGNASFKPDEIANLQKFVNGGGTLLIEAAGGDGEFASIAESLAAQILPTGKLGTLPPDAPLYKAGGIKDVSYRAYARMQGVGSTTAPRLKAITKDGRAAVIVSRDDISTGLLGPEMDGIIGYEPSSAVDILWAVIQASTAK